MSFTIITNSTTISATELNNNFYHIGQGDLLPMGGVSLTAETGQHDLGSSGNKWRSIYVNEIASTLTVSAPMTFNAPVTFNTATSFPSGFLGYFPYFMAWEIYPTSTNATVGSTSYTARTLNTSTSYNLAATMTSGQITLPPGTYEVDAMGTGYQTSLFKIRWYNVTAASMTALGMTAWSQTEYRNSKSHLWGRFTIAATSTFELQQRCATAGSMGLGNSLYKSCFAYAQIVRIS